MEKLKKGMEIKEIPEIAESPEIRAEGPGAKKASSPKKPRAAEEKESKPKIKKPAKIREKQEQPTLVQSISLKTAKIEIEEDNSEEPESQSASVFASQKENWFEEVGELTIDMYQLGKDMIIQSALAGVRPEDLDIQIEKDMVAIRGQRLRSEAANPENFYRQECYWGKFAREIIVPADFDASRTKAVIKNGILTIKIPIIERENKTKVIVER